MPAELIFLGYNELKFSGAISISTKLPKASAERITLDQGDWRYTTIADSAWKCGEEKPDDIAFLLESGDKTFSQIANEARSLITGLKSVGLKSGDTIAFQLPNWIEAASIDIACAALKLVVVPIVPIYRDKELSFILSDANVKAVFIPHRYRSADFRDMYRRLREEIECLDSIILVRNDLPADPNHCEVDFSSLMANEPFDETILDAADPDQLKTILYTSGTTGTPKAVMHTHNTINRVIDNKVDYLSLGSEHEDRMFMASPITHITGYGSINFPFVTGLSTALMERWDANVAVDFITKTRSTVSVGATPFLKELLDAAEARENPLPSMRYFICGGASVPPQIIYRTRKILQNCRAFRVYGSTEAPIITLGWPEATHLDLAAETDGKIYNYDVRIFNENGEDITTIGAEGEIATKGSGMMLGYKDQNQNDAAFIDGYFMTGDIGVLTKDNALIITDRKKDIIIRGGENISAKEVEDLLHHHPSVKEAAVVSSPHPRLGEAVYAFLLINPGFTAPSLTDIKDFSESMKIAKQKIPEAIEILADFPRTPSGKVRKDELRKKLR